MPSSANKIDKPNAAIVLSSNQPVQVYYYDCGFVTPRMHDQQKLREQPPTSSYDQDVYSFWIDYFSDTINSNSNSTQTEE
ncbi:unnamed protein product [Rotaria socialis]|uniref:Uncharacterized protein n=1 Tax=Rotaria socialis TaxID=392032 RepID=A0A818UI06_9BILA|nr:unnamed protein product [Rotaria socialis]